MKKIIDFINEKYPISDTFMNNYFSDIYKQDGNRFKPLGSDSLPGGTIKELGGKTYYYSFHENDPINAGDTEKKSHDSFDMFKKLRGNNDYQQTVEYLYSNKMIEDDIYNEFKNNNTKPAPFIFLDKPSYVFNREWFKENNDKVSFLVDGEQNKWFPKNAINIVYGRGGEGKSTFNFILAGCLVSQREFCCTTTDTTKDCAVVILLNEDNNYQCTSILNKMNLTEEEKRKIATLDYQSQDLSQLEIDLDSDIKNHPSDDYVIIWDSLMGTQTKKENTSDQAAKELYAFFRRILSKYPQVTIIAVGHVSQEMRNRLNDPAALNGNTYWANGSRFMMSFERVDERINVQVTKANCYNDLDMEGQKQQKEPKSFLIEEDYTYSPVEYITPMKKLTKKTTWQKVFDYIINTSIEDLKKQVEDFKNNNPDIQKRELKYSFLYQLGREMDIDTHIDTDKKERHAVSTALSREEKVDSKLNTVINSI